MRRRKIPSIGENKKILLLAPDGSVTGIETPDTGKVKQITCFKPLTPPTETELEFTGLC